MLAGKGVRRTGIPTVRVGYRSRKSSPRDLLLKKVLILPHPLTNLQQIQVCYQNEPRFNGFYSRDDLPNEITDGIYAINLDERFHIRTHWIALYVNAKTITCFDSFRVE